MFTGFANIISKITAFAGLMTKAGVILIFIMTITGGALAADNTRNDANGRELFSEAAAMYINGDYHGAVNILREELQSDTGFANAYNLLGLACLKLHQWDSAEKALRQAIRLDSNYAFAYFNLSEAIYSNPLNNDSQITESIEYLRKSLRIESDSMQIIRIRVRLGDYLYKSGDVGGAQKEYQAALDIDSLCLQARFGFANTLSDSAAILETSKILEIDSSYIPALALQATLSITDNKFLNAIKIYCQIIDLDSSRCQTYRNLVQLVDCYSNTLRYWRDWYFLEGKRRTGRLLSPWFGYKKYKTMIKDQNNKFRRDGKDYQNNLAACSDSLFARDGIVGKLSKLKLSIETRDDSTAFFNMAEFLDVMKSAIGGLRETIESKARRNTICPLPEMKKEDYEIP